MASTKAHHITGWSAGLTAAALVAHAGAGGFYYEWCVLALLAGISGGTAPDWLELAWWHPRKRLWCTHRTITHWGVAWVGALVYSYLLLNTAWWAPPVFGFALGGVTHLLGDWVNPRGVPWILRRHSLNLWTSGRCDVFFVVPCWLGAFLAADYTWWNLSHAHWMLAQIRSMPFCS